MIGIFWQSHNLPYNLFTLKQQKIIILFYTNVFFADDEICDFALLEISAGMQFYKKKWKVVVVNWISDMSEMIDRENM